MRQVHGLLLDEQTRCVHYHTALDIVAIQFRCCHRYYACHRCHAESEPHAVVRWGMADLGQPAVLCGACKSTLTIEDYLSGDFACLSCGSGFNPGCAMHYDLYFNLRREPRGTALASRRLKDVPRHRAAQQPVRERAALSPIRIRSRALASSPKAAYRASLESGTRPGRRYSPNRSSSGCEFSTEFRGVAPGRRSVTWTKPGPTR